MTFTNLLLTQDFLLPTEEYLVNTAASNVQPASHSRLARLEKEHPLHDPIGLKDVKAWKERDDVGTKLEERFSFPQVCQLFRQADEIFLKAKKNVPIALAHTKNALINIAKKTEDINDFKNRVISLFNKNTSLNIDFSRLTPAQTDVVLEVLEKRAANTEIGRLENIVIQYAMEHSTVAGRILENGKFEATTPAQNIEPYLTRLTKINTTIDKIKNGEGEEKANIQFECRYTNKHQNYLCPAADFSNITHLTSLIYDKCYGMDSIPVLSNLPNLTSLSFIENGQLKSLPDLSNLPSLKSVLFRNCSGLQTVQTLKNLPNLISARFIECDLLETVETVENLPKLTLLEFSRCYSLTNMQAELNNLPALKWVRFHFCDDMVTMPRFSNLPNLESLFICGCNHLSTHLDLSTLLELKSVAIIACPRMNTLPILPIVKSEYQHQLNVDLSQSESIPRGNVAALQAQYGEDRLVIKT